MDLYFNGTRYISGGSTAFGTDPVNFGFTLVKIKNDNEDFRFIKTRVSSSERK